MFGKEIEKVMQKIIHKEAFEAVQATKENLKELWLWCKSLNSQYVNWDEREGVLLIETENLPGISRVEPDMWVVYSKEFHFFNLLSPALFEFKFGPLDDYDILTIKPCPFCGEDSLIPSGALFLLDGKEKYVLCPVCSAKGPPANTSAEAVEAWNRRVIYLRGGME